MKNLILLTLFVAVLSACTTSRTTKEVVKSGNTLFTGVAITDTRTGEKLYSYNADKPFVPASNTKILTLFSCLETLGDSIPAFKYFKRNDTLFVLGTADPTLLHPDFPESQALKILKSAKVIVISDQNWAQDHYGAGWAWNDYNEYYQAELSSLPVYGNVLRVTNSASGINVLPVFFNRYFKDTTLSTNRVVRNEWENTYYYDKNKTRSLEYNQEIPFKTSINLTAEMLSETLKIPVNAQPFKIEIPIKTAFSQPVDTVLRKMMQQSDNLLAEQLLLLAGGKFTDTISTRRSIDNLSKLLFSDVTESYRWRDGSGLSRYNLFSPEFMVLLLNKMYRKYPEERLFSLMSVGGKAGTLRNKYKSEIPYVFAKTGSLGGVYNESGYIIAKSGRVLTYSVMKNNFTDTIAENGKKTMEFMAWVRDKY